MSPAQSGTPGPLPWAAPDYGRACLTQVLPSAVRALMREEPVLPVPPADRIVVLLIDGLGHHLLGRARGAAPFLSSMVPLVPEGIDAAFPSTTAASLTSLGTGLPSGRHGIVGAGFWLPETGDVLSPLRWRERPSPMVVQPEPTVFETARAAGVATSSIGPRAYAAGGLTRSALRGATYVGADSPGELIAAVAAAAAGPPPALIYGYFADVDKSGHIHGAESEQWLLDLQWTDRAVEAIASRLPRRTLLLVTADHGMVNSPAGGRIGIDEPPYREGVRRIAGEPRMRHIYIRPGGDPQRVAQRWQDLLQERAVVVTKRQALHAGLFGQVGYGMADRIGDVLALPTGDGALVSTEIDSVVSGLIGQHGGLTEAERKVPLLAWAG